MGQAMYSESAYADAIKRNIMRNAFTTFKRTFERAEEVANFLESYLPERGHEPSKFLESMACALLRDYGKLTPKQYEAVCRSIDTQAERKAARAAAIEEQRARSKHLGVPAERREFTLRVDKIIEVAVKQFSYYSPSTALLYLMRDADGNRVVYKTTGNMLLDDRFPAEGDTVTLKATIKCHEEYKGEKQTIIQRAKLLSFA